MDLGDMPHRLWAQGGRAVTEGGAQVVHLRSTFIPKSRPHRYWSYRAAGSHTPVGDVGRSRVRTEFCEVVTLT